MIAVLIRADASEAIGAGHIVRSMALAEKLKQNGCECIFATRTPTIKVMPSLVNSFPVIEINGALTTETSQLINACPQGVDWLVVDHYEWDMSLENKCRPWAEKIMVIDDLANRKHDVDLLLDQTLSKMKSDYENLVPENCKMFLGPEYALLREQFAERRTLSLNKRLSDDYKLDRVLVSIGMTDPQNITGIAMEGIRQSGLKLSVDVILGKHAGNMDLIMKTADAMDCDINIYNQILEMAKIMERADLAIGAAGSTSWERCCLGVPSFLVTIADNQNRIADALEKNHAAIILGNQHNIKPELFSKKLIELSSNPDQLKSMAVAASTICDGLGANRVAENVLTIN